MEQLSARESAFEWTEIRKDLTKVNFWTCFNPSAWFKSGNLGFSPVKALRCREPKRLEFSALFLGLPSEWNFFLILWRKYQIFYRFFFYFLCLSPDWHSQASCQPALSHYAAAYGGAWGEGNSWFQRSNVSEIHRAREVVWSYFSILE